MTWPAMTERGTPSAAHAKRFVTSLNKILIEQDLRYRAAISPGPGTAGPPLGERDSVTEKTTTIDAALAVAS